MKTIKQHILSLTKDDFFIIKNPPIYKTYSWLDSNILVAFQLALDELIIYARD